MGAKGLYRLKIDKQFKILISPLQRKEYEQLEMNILADGCRDPLITWNGYIVDGHNRYEICTRNRIPFAVAEMDFSSREAALAWICANQLRRWNISEETRRFLIGKQYEAEKMVEKNRNPDGKNQYDRERTVEDEVFSRNAEAPGEHSRTHTADRIAHDNNISRATVEKYAIYSKAMSALAEEGPQLVAKILSGQYKISQKNVIELSKLSPLEIKMVERKIQKMQEPFVQFKKIRRVLNSTSSRAVVEIQGPSVKDMPAFDPDADINGLTLTVPSWSSSIRRVLTKTDLSIVSEKARFSLAQELHSLTEQINDLLSAIEEG